MRLCSVLPLPSQKKSRFFATCPEIFVPTIRKKKRYMMLPSQDVTKNFNLSRDMGSRAQSQTRARTHSSGQVELLYDFSKRKT